MPNRFFPLLIFLLPQFAQAQTDPPLKRFAFQAGVNSSNMDFNKGVPAPPTHAAAAWSTGLSFGLALRVPLAKNFFLQPEYAFTHRNGADKSLETDYSLDYFSLPLLLSYRLSPRLTILAGPQGELLIDARSTVGGQHTNITHDVEERSIGILAGVEVQIIKSVFVSARYLHGLNHIGIGQRSDTKEFKYEAIGLTAGVRF